MVEKPLYGLGNAPTAWSMKFRGTVKSMGFRECKYDENLFFLEDAGRLCGILAIHVDDIVTGGIGNKYRRAINQLRSALPFRKWRVNCGDYVGRRVEQDPVTKSIFLSQKDFASKFCPVKVRQGPDEVSASVGQIS